MTIFDRERQKRADEERRQAEEATKQRQAEDAQRKQERLSQQYLDRSPFPGLLRELKSHLERRDGASASITRLSRQQFTNPRHENYGAVGLTLEECRTMFIPDTTSLFADKPRSYKQLKWIDVIALPNGTIKVEGSAFGKTVLLLDQWRNSNTGLSQKDIAERAIDKAWKYPHAKGTDFRKREDWDAEDIEYWNRKKWWQKLFPG